MIDRFKGPLAALARRADPLLSYRCVYRAKVQAQSADLLRVDVAPDDALLPPMANVPLCHGVPGLTVKIAAGAVVMVGWANGRPDAPFAALWANPTSTGAANAAGAGGAGGGVELVALVSAAVHLAAKDPANRVMLGDAYRSAEVTLHSTLAAKLFKAAEELALAAGAPTHTLAQPGLGAAGQALGLAASAIEVFELGAGGFLSTKVRTG